MPRTSICFTLGTLLFFIGSTVGAVIGDAAVAAAGCAFAGNLAYDIWRSR